MSTEASQETHFSPPRSNHLFYLRQCLDLARHSPPKPTNFRVGCVIVLHRSDSAPEILSTGYTLELEGNTHAEQCALTKLAQKLSTSEDRLNEALGTELGITLYTSLEPCGKRLSGNLPCVQRIIATSQGSPSQAGGIRKVVFGAKEPGTFVRDSQSCRLLTEAGIEWEYVADLETEILHVAMEGHIKEGERKVEDKGAEQPKSKGASIDDISEEERKRQQALPRNPKKRMMEVDVDGTGPPGQ